MAQNGGVDPDVVAQLKAYKPQTDAELHAWISIVCGFEIPREAVCEEHCSAFQPISDLFFERVLFAIVLANRGGGKTQNCAALNYMEALHKPGIEIASVGAILAQAKKCYRYMRKFMKDDVKLGLIESPTMSSTDFVNGSRVEVITGKTAEAVNSPHPHRATMDEYEQMEWEILQEAWMMPVSDDKYNGGMRLVSTRKRPDGNVQRLLDESEQRGFTVYQYCALEVTEKCRFDVRPSCEPCKQIIKYDHQNEPISFYDICKERLRNADGYLKIDMLIQQFASLDVEVFQAQIAPCSVPVRGATCFGEFNPGVHVLPDIQYDPALPIGCGWDFGLDDPMVCLIFQWDTDAIYQIAEIGSGPLAPSAEKRERMVDEVGLHVLNDFPSLGNSRACWCDPSGTQRSKVDGRSCVQELRNLGLHVRYRGHPDPPTRIKAIKRRLRRHSTTGKPRFYISKSCSYTIRALQFAEWKRSVDGKISKETYKHDELSHPLDALGYFIDGQWPNEGRDGIQVI